MCATAHGVQGRLEGLKGLRSIKGLGAIRVVSLMDEKMEEKAAEVVVTRKAFHMACSWVQKMSGGADFDVEQETKVLDDDGADVRPARLGLGAKYLSHAQANHVSSQVDRKLRAKLVPIKSGTSYQGGRKDSKSRDKYEEEAVQAQTQDEHDDDEDDSRASVFKKRSSAFSRPALIVSETAGSKKKKRKGS